MNTTQILPEHSKGDGAPQRLAHLQRTRILNQAQRPDGLNSKQELAALMGVMRSGQNQQANTQNPQPQQTSSHGIQNIFADPNYGIGSKPANSPPASDQPAGKNTATAQSRHLHSPREEFKVQVVGGRDESRPGVNESKVLWMQSN